MKNIEDFDVEPLLIKQRQHEHIMLSMFYNLELIDELISQFKKKNTLGFTPAELAQISVLASYLEYILDQYR